MLSNKVQVIGSGNVRKIAFFVCDFNSFACESVFHVKVRVRIKSFRVRKYAELRQVLAVAAVCPEMNLRTVKNLRMRR